MDRQLNDLNSHLADLAGLSKLEAATDKIYYVMWVYCLLLCRKSVNWTGS
jgi:hypothetical protein